jgi:hypothetical protein
MFKNDSKDKLRGLFQKAGSGNPQERHAAAIEITKALNVPIREAILSASILSDIYTPEDFRENPDIRYPVDGLLPGQESEYYAYVMPNHGRIPAKRFETDYVMIPTYRVANAIDATIQSLRRVNWPMINRMIEILEAGFVKKMNDDGWQTILAAATNRNIRVNDPDAAASQFTPRLVSLMKTVMRRNAGGNATSLKRGKLTDLYVSPEALDDIRAWGLDLIPDAARTRIFYSNDDGGDLLNVYGVRLHGYDEFGAGQEYQSYYTDLLGGTLAGSDTELVVGLDQQFNDSFVHPIVQEVELTEDANLHREGLFGMYGSAEIGFAVLDSRRTILGSF